MKESSLAEKVTAGLLVVFVSMMVTALSMLYNLNRDVGEIKSSFQSHTTNHPNIGLERRIDRHEDQMH